MDKEEKYHQCDLGTYNDIIKGYLIAAMRNADFKEPEINRALDGLREAFDWVSAEAAEAMYLNRF